MANSCTITIRDKERISWAALVPFAQSIASVKKYYSSYKSCRCYVMLAGFYNLIKEGKSYAPHHRFQNNLQCRLFHKGIFVVFLSDPSYQKADAVL